MNWKVIIGVVVSVVALAFLSLIGVLVYKFFMYRTDITLAEDFLIKDQWQEINVKDRLPTLSKDTNCIYIAAPNSFEAFNVERGIVAPDGTVIIPDVEAVDTNGEIYTFVQSGARRGSRYEMATYVPKPEIQREVKIDRLRVRANQSIRVPVILWSSYDVKDLP